MFKRNASQNTVYLQYQGACSHRDYVLQHPDSSLEQREQAELDVTQARRYMYNATTLRKGETVESAFNRTYPELI